MKHVRKIILLITVISVFLSTLSYASPIDTIIDSSPGTTTFEQELEAAANEVINKESKDSGLGGWIANIINMFIGIWFTGWILPLSVALGGFDMIGYIIFNKISLYRLTFFDTDGGGIAGGLMGAVAPIYVAFRYLAIICYILIILYLAIRMLLSTVGKQKAMYKELIKHWVTGIMILLTFNWLMTYTIVLSDTLVEILAKSIGYEGAGMNLISNNLGSVKNVLSSGFFAIGYVIILLGINVVVHWTYLKRVFTIALLIMIFPLITITYVFDKIGDRKSQILSAWVREFMTNVFVQPIQAIALILILMAMKAVDNGVGLGGAVLGMFNPLIKILLLMMLFPAEKLVKKIFDVNPSINGGGFAGSKAGMISTIMMGSKVAPMLADNFGRKRASVEANAANKRAESAYNKAPTKANYEKLEETRRQAEIAKQRTKEGKAALAGAALGLGIGGDPTTALTFAGLADKGVETWAKRKGKGTVKDFANSEFGSLKSAVENYTPGSDSLTAEQKKSIANKMNGGKGISVAELERDLDTQGGKEHVLAMLDSEHKAAIARGEYGKESAELERDNFKNRISIDKTTGNYKDADGNVVAEKGKLRQGRNSMVAFDSANNLVTHIVDADGNGIRDTKLADNEYIDYDYEISEDSKIKIEGTALGHRAEKNAREKTLRNAGLLEATVAEQDEYLQSVDGQKDMKRNRDIAIQKEVEVVETLREKTGIQTLNVTSVGNSDGSYIDATGIHLPPAPPAGGTPPAAGGTPPAADYGPLLEQLSKYMLNASGNKMEMNLSGLSSDLQSLVRGAMDNMTSAMNIAGNNMANTLNSAARNLDSAGNNVANVLSKPQPKNMNDYVQTSVSVESIGALTEELRNANSALQNTMMAERYTGMFGELPTNDHGQTAEYTKHTNLATATSQVSPEEKERAIKSGIWSY